VETKGPLSSLSKKPDKYGTVCLTSTYCDGSSTSICSDGTIKINSIPFTSRLKRKVPKDYDPLLLEASRCICKDGTIIRTLRDEYGINPFIKDIMIANGSRILINRSPDVIQTPSSDPAPTTIDGEEEQSIASVTQNELLEKDNKTPSVHNKLKSFYRNLLSNAPSQWNYILLKNSGEVLYFTSPLGSTTNEVGISYPNLVNIRNRVIDAETKAVVYSYLDGRVLTMTCDTRVEVIFNEGTKIIRAPTSPFVLSSGEPRHYLILIEKNGLDTIEIDSEIDNMGNSHSKGIEVPINKGGERVRRRIAMKDGSAVLV